MEKVKSLQGPEMCLHTVVYLIFITFMKVKEILPQEAKI